MRDDLGERYFEELIYGTPIYSFGKTPDGRIVGELSKARKEENIRHSDLMRVQGSLANALKDIHGGRDVVPRDQFQTREAVNLLATTSNQIGSLSGQFGHLLDETRLLAEITNNGLSGLGNKMDSLGGRMEDVRDAVIGVGKDTITGINGLRDDVRNVGKDAKGPSRGIEKMDDLVLNPEILCEAIAAHKNGILNEKGRRELQDFVDRKLGSPEAGNHISGVIYGDTEEARKTGKMRTTDMLAMIRKIERLFLHPSDLIKGDSMQEEALITLGAIAQIDEEERFKHQAVSRFIQNCITVFNIFKKAKNIPISQEFLVDLVNNHLVPEAVAFDVKRTTRQSRMDGSAVDRNFNLMELLEQGDRREAQGVRAEIQRGEMTTELRKQTSISSAIGITQIAQGKESSMQREQMLESLQHVVEILVASSGQLIDIRELAKQLIDILDAGFSEVAQVLGTGFAMQKVGQAEIAREVMRSRDESTHVMRQSATEIGDKLDLGFAMQREALTEIAQEIAISRVEILMQLGKVEQTIRSIGVGIQTALNAGNRNLERLVQLTEGSLSNVAVQRGKQGWTFLQVAEIESDYQEALRLFEEGIKEDPTIVVNQYGAAIAQEALGDEEGALSRYRNTGRLAKSDDVIIEAYLKYATIRLKRGEPLEAQESLKKVLEKDPYNMEARFMLAKSFALTGFEEEALQILIKLIERDEGILNEIKLEPAFSKILPKIIEMLRGTEGARAGIDLESITSDLKQAIDDHDLEKCLEIMQFGFENCPGLVLSKKWLTNIPEGIRLQLVEIVTKIIQNKPEFYSAEAWYAIAFIALRLGVMSEDIRLAFREGAKMDIDYNMRDYKTVKQTLRRIDPEKVDALLYTLQSKK
ncbi:MAG: tetratricopeptide repeat protein [Candidatus Gracilibacteria bacterium]